MSESTLVKLRAAVQGLIFVSERDAPFEVFEWKTSEKLTPVAIRDLGGHPKRAKVVETEFEPFFEALTKDESCHGAEEVEQAVKYRELLAIFRSNLADPAIFCVGMITVTYYIVGRSSAGSWVGVKTLATET